MKPKDRGLKGAMVLAYLEKYPTTPSRTLGRLIYKEEFPLFETESAALGCVRYYRGKQGKTHRAAASVIIPYESTGDCAFENLPEPIAHFDNWNCYELSGKMRVGVLGDIHIPYHDGPALKAALRYLIDYNPTHILLNGDTCDFYSVSDYEKDPRKRRFSEERDMIVKFLTALRKMFPKAVIIFRDGNHEERYARYMRVQAPALLGLKEFELEEILKLNSLNIIRVKDKRIIRFGQHLHSVHGHEWAYGISSPVNPARGFFLRAKVCCFGGHLHKTSEHSENNLGGKVISCWSHGCLCNLHPDYSPINGWNHGFMTVDIEADDSFFVRNLKVIDGQVY